MKENNHIKTRYFNKKTVFVKVVAIVCALLIAGSAFGVTLSILH